MKRQIFFLITAVFWMRFPVLSHQRPIGLSVDKIHEVRDLGQGRCEIITRSGLHFFVKKKDGQSTFSILNPGKGVFTAARSFTISPGLSVDGKMDRPMNWAAAIQEAIYGEEIYYVNLLAQNFFLKDERDLQISSLDETIDLYAVLTAQYWNEKSLPLATALYSKIAMPSLKKVTNRDYQRFIEAVGYTSPTHWIEGRIPSGEEMKPVVNISYQDAFLYTIWAGLRLPAIQELKELYSSGTLGDCDDGLWEWTSTPCLAEKRKQLEHCLFSIQQIDNKSRTAKGKSLNTGFRCIP